MVHTMIRLALDGGTPVRSALMPQGRGMSYLGEDEKRAVLEVLAARSLFRYYGPDLRRKVEQFEALRRGDGRADPSQLVV